MGGGQSGNGTGVGEVGGMHKRKQTQGMWNGGKVEIGGGGGGRDVQKKANTRYVVWRKSGDRGGGGGGMYKRKQTQGKWYGGKVEMGGGGGGGRDVQKKANTR